MFEGLVNIVKNFEIKQREKSSEGKVDLMNPAHRDVKEMRYQMQLDGVKVSDQNKLLGKMAKEKKTEAEGSYRKAAEEKLKRVREELAGKFDDQTELDQQVAEEKRKLEITGKHYTLDPREPFHQVDIKDYPNSLYDSPDEDK